MNRCRVQSPAPSCHARHAYQHYHATPKPTRSKGWLAGHYHQPAGVAKMFQKSLADHYHAMHLSHAQPTTCHRNDKPRHTMSTKAESEFEIQIYNHFSIDCGPPGSIEKEVFASVRHIETGNGADFYSGGEEIGWQDNNSLLLNCDEETIAAARKFAFAALR